MRERTYAEALAELEALPRPVSKDEIAALRSAARLQLGSASSLVYTLDTALMTIVVLCEELLELLPDDDGGGPSEPRE